MNCSSSIEPSIIIEEVKSTESSSLCDNRRDDARFKQLQKRSEGEYNSDKNNIGIMSASHCGGSPFSNTENPKMSGLPPIPSCVSQREGVDPFLPGSTSINTTESDPNGITVAADDEMADRVLHILERKDALLAEQSLCLQHRDAALAEMRRELDTLREEKRILLERLRHFVSVDADGSSSFSALALLERAETSLRDERAARETDAAHFRARMSQQTAALAAAAARERRGAEELSSAQRELSSAQRELSSAQRELSALAGRVGDAHALQSAVRRAEADAAAAAAARSACAAERDRVVRELQHTLCRERAEWKCEAAALRRAHATEAAARAKRNENDNESDNERDSERDDERAERAEEAAGGERLRAGVAECARGAARLEQCLRAAVARESAASSALETARATAAAERLEQQRLAADMQSFFRARLDALRAGAEAQRERAEGLEREAAVAQTARAALEDALQRARAHGEEMATRAEEMQKRAERAEEMQKRAERAEAERSAAEAAEKMARHEREREREREKDRERAKEKEKSNERPVARSLLDGWRERLQSLEEQLRAAHEERNAAEQRATAVVASLERKHRDAARQLEDTMRRRLAEFESATRQAAAQRTASDAAARRRGAARVIAELLAFVRAVESFASTRRAQREAQESPLEESDALRAACDDIARGCLGIEGGWEALRQPAKSLCDAQKKECDGQISAAMRHRVRRLLTAYVEAQFDAAEESRGGKDERERGSGRMEQGRRSSSRSDVDEHPLRELLMECVRCAFGEEDMVNGDAVHENIHQERIL